MQINVTNIGQNESTVNLTGLIPGSSYSIMVNGPDGSFSASFDTISPPPPPPPEAPPAPENLRYSSPNPNTVVVECNSVPDHITAGPALYRLYYGIGGGQFTNFPDQLGTTWTLSDRLPNTHTPVLVQAYYPGGPMSPTTPEQASPLECWTKFPKAVLEFGGGGQHSVTIKIPLPPGVNSGTYIKITGKDNQVVYHNDVHYNAEITIDNLPSGMVFVVEAWYSGPDNPQSPGESDMAEVATLDEQ